MSNRILYALGTIGLYFFVNTALAVGFIATIDDNKISFGQGIHLTLQLEDAKPIANIDLSPLVKDFTIYSQQQFSSYSNVNGIIKSESGWHVILMPKKVGEFVIPAIEIDTDKGMLRTQEINVAVQQTQASNKNANDTVGISLVSTISKAKAYVNEAVIYSIKIIAYKPIASIVLEDIKSNDAIIEKIGEPKQYEQSLGGVRAHIIEIKYAITALKAGKITISPASMHGEMHEPVQQSQRNQRFGLFNNLFLENTHQLKPFSLQSEAITIDIASAPVTANNWLPANKVTLSQTWEKPQNIKVGETITRKIKIVANGTFAKQLPTVKNFIEQDGVKVYGNKPVFTDKVDADKSVIVGIREEEYSIVPQQAGTVILPEIKIKWWNLHTNKFEVSTLPAEKLEVASVAVNSSANVTVDYSAETPQVVNDADKTAVKKINSTIFSMVIGALSGIFATLFMLLVFLFIKKRKLRFTIKPEENINKSTVTIKTVAELRAHILQHAIKNWHSTKDITLNGLGDVLKNSKYNYNAELYAALLQNINAALYANVNVNIEALTAEWVKFKATVVKNKQKKGQAAQEEAYAGLNPT